MPGTLTLDGLEKLVRGGEIDTVLVTFPDQQGRLMGKRVTGSFFLDQWRATGCTPAPISSPSTST